MVLLAGIVHAQTEAEQLIQAGHWKRARAIVEARLHQAPNDALANYLLSQIRYAFGDHAAPLTFAEKAVASNGTVAKYHRQLAEALGVEAQQAGPVRQLFLAHRFRKEVDTALALDATDAQALRDLMEFYLLAPGIAGGDREKAEATAGRIAAVNAPEGLLARARIAELRKQPAAREGFLQQAAKAQPPSYRARIELARFEFAKDHPGLEAAEAAAKDALELEPARVDAYSILASIYALRGEWSALEETLMDASEHVSDDLTPYDRAAETLLKHGHDPARAERYLRTYLSQEPEGNEPPAAEARRELSMALRDQSHSATDRAAVE